MTLVEASLRRYGSPGSLRPRISPTSTGARRDPCESIFPGTHGHMLRLYLIEDRAFRRNGRPVWKHAARTEYFWFEHTFTNPTSAEGYQFTIGFTDGTIYPAGRWYIGKRSWMINGTRISGYAHFHDVNYVGIPPSHSPFPLSNVHRGSPRSQALNRTSRG